MHSQQPSRRQGPYQPQSDNPSQRPPWEEPPGQYQRPPGEQSPGGPYQPPPVTPYQSPPDGLYQQALPPRRPHRVRNWVFGVSGPPRVFRTAKLSLFHAASCRFRYSSRASCGVRYPSPE